MSSTRFFNSNQETGRVYVIAEAGLNHNGSLELAKEMVDIAAKAGADAVKFQKRTVDILAIGTVLDAQDGRFPTFGSTYRQIREHIELDRAAYQAIMNQCRDQGIEFLCTAFDLPAMAFLEDLGLTTYKLASHSLGNLPLLNGVAQLQKPTILSTGMAEWDEIDRAVEIFQSYHAPLALLHCVSIYPTPPEASNLAMIEVLRNRYNLPVGYSGHEIGFLPTLAAVAMGATIVERHFTKDATLPGFDHKISLEPQALTDMISAIRTIETMRGSGLKSVSPQEMVTRHKYHVSMVSAIPLAKNEILTTDHIVYRNPGTGIPPKDAIKYLGRRLAQAVEADVLITPEMFDA
ncbi:MAG: N-acetylneuraminate synthase family protein [Magnetococcales bacterium]|nr:N-acetylneuraminate synthase family protein [Magnetococcales bacterium]MBF0438324.1 N-acetylneuraminate synthase family protein [Magnetococcales bacterium]